MEGKDIMSKNAELAAELEQRVEQVVDGEFELGVMIRVNSELPRIIAALRRESEPAGKAVLEEGYRQGYFDAAAGRKPSVQLLKASPEPAGAAPEHSGEFVMVPREATGVIIRALEDGPEPKDNESWQDYQRRQWAYVLQAIAAHEQKPSGEGVK